MGASFTPHHTHVLDKRKETETEKRRQRGEAVLWSVSMSSPQIREEREERRAAGSSDESYKDLHPTPSPKHAGRGRLHETGGR